MGFIGALVSVCKAMPVLERLVCSLADAVREAKAKSRYEAKLDHIDSALDAFILPDGGVEQRRGVDQPPAVPGGSDKRTGVDKEGTP